MRGRSAALILLLAATPAVAQAPEESLRPVLRAGSELVTQPVLREAAEAENLTEPGSDVAAAAEPDPDVADDMIASGAETEAVEVETSEGEPVSVAPDVEAATEDTGRPVERPGEEIPEVSNPAPVPPPDTDIAAISSPRPPFRPDTLPPPAPELSGPVGSHEITVRGGLFGASETIIRVPAYADDGATAVLLSPRPDERPAGLEQRVRAAATRTTPARVTQPGSRGQLCGRPGILGERLEPITGRSSGCGIAEPVRVREIDGVALTTPATINCSTARALQDWLNQAAIPIVGRTGGGISNLRVVASYACRTRNSQAGARLSEHATGSAIDIAGIGLVNGQELSVLGGWHEASQSRILRQLHASACGPFGTVLGPASDRFHEDHFHFDTAGYRAGPYCR
ncbi:hypothetical protein HKCCE3408_02360 [Rhodobacterales bacterium HKCCE3408]|nr:hypothetical protein [Rhodobacterales bacterium HKCCE3408]